MEQLEFDCRLESEQDYLEGQFEDAEADPEAEAEEEQEDAE